MTGPQEVIFGRRPVLEALKAGRRSLHKVWIATGTHGTEDILKLARERGVPVEFMPRHQLDRKAQGNHQGVVAQASAADFLRLEDFLRSIREKLTGERIVIVALDEIQDPHNIGAILRSAGFFGVAAMIVPQWRSGPVSETAARASSGGIEHVPLIRVTNLAQAVLDLQESGFEVIGADMEGAPLAAYKPGKRVVIVVGNEGDGLRRLVRERCDQVLAIPGGGEVDSLNVAATAAIFLYHFSISR